jgi:hypothetical protein
MDRYRDRQTELSSEQVSHNLAEVAKVGEVAIAPHIATKKIQIGPGSVSTTELVGFLAIASRPRNCVRD